MAVARPHRQSRVVGLAGGEQAGERRPLERTLVVRHRQIALVGVDHEHERQPLLTLRAEVRPGDRAPEAARAHGGAGLLEQLAPQTLDDRLVGIDLAAEPVHLAEVVVVGPRIAPDQQHAVGLVVPHVHERADDGGERSRSSGHGGRG